MEIIFSVLGRALASVVEWAVSFFAVFRAGEKAQKDSDNAASLQDAKDANAIKNEVSGESPSAVDTDLGKWVRPNSHL